MTIKDLFLRFKKEIETTDKDQDEGLKTHYYKGNVSELFETVEKIISNDADCEILTISKERGELAAEIKKPIPCSMVVTIAPVKPLETAVDFNLSTKKFSLFGAYPALKNRIISFYDRIDKLHT